MLLLVRYPRRAPLTARLSMATPTRVANVGLYRKLFRAANTFASYNTRDYAVRYVRDDFRAAAALSGQEVRLCVCLRRAQSFL